MTRGIFKAFFCAAAVFAFSLVSAAQTTFGGIVSVDKTVHDWGDVTVKDGPLSCEFSVRNISDAPVRIKTVASSCGCTGVVWTREDIAPGESGTIKATYSNDEGPYAFDKTLTVSFADVRKPLILHLRGVVHPKKMPLKDTYTVQFGSLGFREAEIKIGNLSQGETKSSQVRIANVGKKAITVSFTDAAPQLIFTPAEITVQPGTTAEIGVSVTADRSLWGTNLYRATPVVNGERQDGQIAFRAVTRENFDTWTSEQLARAACAEYDSSAQPDPVDAGTPIKTSYKIKNTGKSTLNIYKVEFNSDNIRTLSSVRAIKPGSGAVFSFETDTSAMKPDRENLGIVTLYTNDPRHPMIHLYIDAIIL